MNQFLMVAADVFVFYSNRYCTRPEKSLAMFLIPKTTAIFCCRSMIYWSARSLRSLMMSIARAFLWHSMELFRFPALAGIDYLCIKFCYADLMPRLIILI